MFTKMISLLFGACDECDSGKFEEISFPTCFPIASQKPLNSGESVSAKSATLFYYYRSMTSTEHLLTRRLCRLELRLDEAAAE